MPPNVASPKTVPLSAGGVCFAPDDTPCIGVLRATAESSVFRARGSTRVTEGFGAGALGGVDDLGGVGELAGLGGSAGVVGLAARFGGDTGFGTLGRTDPSSVGSSSAPDGFPGTPGSGGLPEFAIISSKKPSSAEAASLSFLNRPVSTTLTLRSRVTEFEKIDSP